ncbi:uncharacterized protein tbc1d10c [Leuresthes tenuis]|uniref:uncharacterized protein tbc1d10c n=1 Tax=Leuresthes tenuis TaxID=355514 RepID=UPI003B50888B
METPNCKHVVFLFPVLFFEALRFCAVMTARKVHAATLHSDLKASSEVTFSVFGQASETVNIRWVLCVPSFIRIVGPSPELVRQREAKWINIMGQWDRILVKKSSKVKVQCQKGIPASLRAKCWPLLCGASDRMKQNKNTYESLDSQPGLQSWVDIIERDLDRQFPFHEMFLSKDGHGQRGLFRVLKAYTQYQPEEGYCQAQGPVAAVLLMNMPAEEAFWCLVQISEQYLPGYYSPLLEGVLFDAAMMTWVLKKTCPAAHKHLQQHGVEPLMFATDWLMCLFTRHLPFNTLLRVWDLFFCYGVRVLLQVAVVLVRRVLGRAEQRKQCQGQMETLERLRGVREEVQEEDNAFIAEVCSVPLSSKDLERRTEKELKKWRKDRPSSTFDPGGRCHGYRMAWAKAQQNIEERERKEREKGNLSVPLARSASTLSLSPSLLHKRWKKGGKVNTGDWEGGKKVVRHLSMGAKDDWKSWNSLDLKNVKGVQEENVISEGHEIKEELKLTEETEQEENQEELETQNTPTEHTEEIVTAEKQTGNESQLKETAESKMLLEPREETNPCPVKEDTVENVLRPSELMPPCEQDGKLDTVSQSQVLEEQSHKSTAQESEVQDTDEETEKPVTDREHTSDTDDNHTKTRGEAADGEVGIQVTADSREELTIQADMKPEAGMESENAQQVLVNTVTEASETTSETSLDPETDRDVKDSTLDNQDPTTDTQQEEKEVITETEEDLSEEKNDNTESSAETEKKEESHTQTNTETDVLAETREAEENVAAQDELNASITQTDSEQRIDSEAEAKTVEATTVPSSPECLQQKEDSDLVADTQTEAKIAAADDTKDKSVGAIVAESVQEKEEIAETVRTETHGEACVCDQTNAAQTQIETNEETADFSTQDEALNHSNEPEQMSSEKESSSETQAPKQSTDDAATGAVEEAGSSENAQGNTAEDDVFKSTEPTDDPLSNTQAQVEESPFTKGQSEPHDSSLEQTSGRCSSRSSGDFCVRKSSTSRGSRLARRLSEDLFTIPPKTNRPQFSPNDPEPQPRAVTTTAPAEATEDTSVQPEQQPDNPKRFGLLRRLRGEQSKNTKAKGTAKMQVPQILIQDFSDGTGKPVEDVGEGKLSSRERRRKRRERERREKEEERLKRKKEKEQEKGKEKERRKPQTRGKSFQVQKEKSRDDTTHPAATGSQTLKYSSSYAETFF